MVCMKTQSHIQRTLDMHEAQRTAHAHFANAAAGIERSHKQLCCLQQHVRLHALARSEDKLELGLSEQRENVQRRDVCTASWHLITLATSCHRVQYSGGAMSCPTSTQEGFEQGCMDR